LRDRPPLSRRPRRLDTDRSRPPRPAPSVPSPERLGRPGESGLGSRLMPSLPDSIADTALARLFAGDDPSPEVSWFSVPGGQHLYDAGSQADELYFLRAGRLGVVRREEGQEPQFIGVIRPGEPVGEMGVLAGGVHHATVVALRDSEVLSIPRRAFFEAIEEDPTVMLEVARLMIQRTRANAEHMGGSEPSVFGFIGVSHGTKVRELAERLSDCIEAQGYVSVV